MVLHYYYIIAMGYNESDFVFPRRVLLPFTSGITSPISAHCAPSCYQIHACMQRTCEEIPKLQGDVQNLIITQAKTSEFASSQPAVT